MQRYLWLTLMGSGALLLFVQRGSRPPHFVELLTHFYPQAVAVWAVAVLSFVACGLFIPALKAISLARRWQNLSFVLLFVALLLPLTAYYLPALALRSADSTSAAVRVVLANVLFSNTHTDTFAQWLSQQQADVVVIEELNRSYEAFMHRQSAYPYYRVAYTGDPFGIGIWSRFPFAEAETLHLGPAQLPSLYVRLATPAPLHVLATHPYPPISGAYFTARNAQYTALAEFLTKKQGAKIVVGDLNITPWSGYYQQWVQTLGLRNSREGNRGEWGQGLLPSWPVHWPAPLRIPIDHVLVSDGVHAETLLGPEIGSDHLPLAVSLRVPT